MLSEAQCGKRYLNGAVGGTVTLNVGHTGATSIVWLAHKNRKAIARTKAQESP